MAISTMINAIKEILPKSVAIDYVEINRCRAALYPEEAAYVEKAVPKRKQEFSAGRECGRRVLRSLGVSENVIPVGTFRQPIWPNGISASITHEANCCIAVGAKQSDISLIGIDLSTSEPLDPTLIDLICTTDDLVAMDGLTVATEIDPYKLIFSIKEAIYKCLFPIVRRTFDFSDVAISLHQARNTASVSLLNQSLFLGFDQSIYVAYYHTDGFIFSVAWVPGLPPV